MRFTHSCLFVGTSLLALSVTARAATFTVTNTADSGAGSLRQAILDANATSAADTITFGSAFSSPQTIALTSGALEVTQSLTIQGSTAGVVVSGSDASTVFVVSGGTSEFRGLTITHGKGRDGADRRQEGGGTGGIDTSGAVLTLVGCTLSYNQGGNGSGGSSAPYSMVVNGGNGGAGALSVRANASVTLQNSTLASNSGGSGGSQGINVYGERGTAGKGGAGGIVVGVARLQTNDCTIALNRGGSGGGGVTFGQAGVGGVNINDSEGSFSLGNTLLAANLVSVSSPSGPFPVSIPAPPAADLAVRTNSLIQSQGYNLVGETTAVSSLGAGGDSTAVSSAALKLDSAGLKNNGGPTPTLQLLPGSVAVDKGNSKLTSDQRGKPRPFGIASDIGAYELQDANTPPLVTIATPAQNQVLTAASFSAITGSAMDLGSVTAVRLKLFRIRGGVSYYWNGSGFTTTITQINATLASPNTSSTSWSYGVSAALKATLDEGVYFVYAYGRDALGNQSGAVGRGFTLSSDTTAPTPYITFPAQNQTVSLATPSSFSAITGYATDNAGVKSVRIKLFRTTNGVSFYWNGTSFTKTPTLFNATVSSVGDKTVTWNYPISSALRLTLAQTTQSPRTMFVYAYGVDTAGNQSGAVARSFIVTTSNAKTASALTVASSPLF